MRPQLTETERFWSKVDKTTECWLWAAGRFSTGYGAFTVNHVPVLAHRYAWRLARGLIPDGLQLDHLCRVRHCVNPDHLEPVTSRENLMRAPDTQATKNTLKTHCRNGHPFDEANTYVYKGSRRCRECVRQSNRDQWSKVAHPPHNRDKTHCPAGHALTEPNIYWTPDGRRRCKHCVLASNAEWQRKNRRKRKP